MNLQSFQIKFQLDGLIIQIQKLYSFGNTLRLWNLRRILRCDSILHHMWQRVPRIIVVLQVLETELRELTTWFLYINSNNGVRGSEVTVALCVEAQACVLILNLDIIYFYNRAEVILYPSASRVNHVQLDAIDLVHSDANVLRGEACLSRRVVLSWDDVERDTYQPQHGRNVVFHEFSHNLFGLTGVVNGLATLHHGMNLKRWAEDFSKTYEALCQQVAAGKSACIYPFAATSLAEFSVVLSEYFITAPDIFKNCCSVVHRQLTLFYRDALSLGSSALMQQA